MGMGIYVYHDVHPQVYLNPINTEIAFLYHINTAKPKGNNNNVESS
jgi:hypothetical protein